MKLMSFRVVASSAVIEPPSSTRADAAIWTTS
jgi:hypothetical protein